VVVEYVVGISGGEGFFELGVPRYSLDWLVFTDTEIILLLVLKYYGEF